MCVLRAGASIAKFGVCVCMCVYMSIILYVC